VAKTLKLFTNGSFVRSESGRTYPVAVSDGSVIEVCDASRKDVRDALRAGSKAAGTWAGMAPYLRGQILYRMAEMVEARADELDDTARLLGVTPTARDAVDLAVAYAGWCDKLGLVLGGTPEVPGHSVATAPRPLGLCATWLPESAAAVHVLDAVAASLSGANASLVLAGGPAGALMSVMAEAVATADVPPGVVQLLSTGSDEAVMTAAGATDVQALDVVGHPRRVELEAAAAASLTRCRTGRHEPSVDAYATLASLRWQIGYTTTWSPLGR
jgi:acyl-CoA reductase-like NAD-dependent aldehyde dehydrogenase